MLKTYTRGDSKKSDKSEEADNEEIDLNNAMSMDVEMS